MIDLILEVAGQMRKPWVEFHPLLATDQAIVLDPPAVKNRTILVHPDHRELVEAAIREGIFRAEIRSEHEPNDVRPEEES